MRHARTSPLILSTVLATAALLAAGEARAQDGVLTEHPLGESAAPYGYVEYLPPTFSADPALRRPLVVMLHGAGERGNGTSDLGKVNAHGPTKQIGQGDTFWGDHQAVIIAPQVPTNGWWDPNLVAQLVDSIVAERHIDAYQVIVTGLSMGGGGTWDYVRAQGRSRVSVALPICGASGPADGAPFGATATWAFHAWSDGTVPSSNSIGWVDHIADARAGADVADVLTGYPHVDGNPGNPAADNESAAFDGAAWAWAPGVDTSGSSTLRLTLYPDGSHDSWTRTYDNVDVKNWMFAHRRADPAEAIGATIVVDNLDDGATFEGAWAREADTAGFWGWDEHRATAAPGVKATFSTPVGAGRYELFLSYAAGADRAVVSVNIQAGDTVLATLDVDQKVGGGFVSLGEFDFDGALDARVVVDGSAGTGQVVADAIALRPADVTSGSGGAGAGGDDTGSGSGAGGPSGSGGDDGGGASHGGDGDGDGDGDGGGDGPGGPGSGTSTGTDGGLGGGATDGDATEDDGSGCDCRIDRQGPMPSGSGLAVGILALGAAVSRRRRR